METLIVPAIIANSQDELNKMLDRLRGKAKRIQLDIMDGNFVSNTSLDFDFEVPPDFEYEAHLMTTKPLEWVEKNSIKVDTAILQVETLDDINGAIVFTKAKGLKVMLALNPETKVETVLPYLDKIDGILILTVDPGSYCVDFFPEPLEKAKTIRNVDDKLPIEIDGCMSPEHVKVARDAGANIFASGSYIVKSTDPGRAIKELENALNA